MKNSDDSSYLTILSLTFFPCVGNSLVRLFAEADFDEIKRTFREINIITLFGEEIFAEENVVV